MGVAGTSMEMFKVRALYDFVGEPNTAEISIQAGDILTVTRTSIGDGWWEGLNAKGETGLFPEAYVERLDVPAANSVPRSSIPSQPPAVDDDWDDEWDNDDTYSEIGQVDVGGSSASNRNEAIYSNEGTAIMHSLATSGLNTPPSESGDKSGAVPSTKKSLNRFSSYVKSGLESYILGTLKDGINDHAMGPRLRILKDSTGNLIHWQAVSGPYTVQVTSPKKATKMGGLKSFIAYQLTPSFTGIEVSRRYKHFDWLHDRLSEKFNVIAVPPLPDKQISGRYEEHFVEHRRVQLQEFVDYMCRHPILAMCEVWHHFLTCTDEKQWKMGKRNAERDQLIGANFCLCIDAPDKELLASNVDTRLDLNINYMTQMDQNIKTLMNTAMDQQKKSASLYKREYAKVGEAFFSLGAAFEIQEKGMFTEMSIDVKRIGTTYISIAKLFEDHAKLDWQPLADKLYLYRGITSSFPDIFNLQRHGEHKKREVERGVGQMPSSQIGGVRKRTDVLTYTVFAELDHFQNEMHHELRKTLRNFLQEQVTFYRQIVDRLEDTLKRFE